MSTKRVVITGMSINTPLGDNLDVYIDKLIAGTSAITKWESLDSEKIYCKVGGDIKDYDVKAKVKSYEGRIPDVTYKRILKMISRFPAHMGISIQVAVDAFIDAGLIDKINEEDNDIATVVAGHNLNQQYTFDNHEAFDEEPDFIEGLFALKALDTNHVGIVSEALQLRGPGYTVGGACASGNMALRCAVDEIRGHGLSVAAVVAPILSFSPLDLQGMAVMGAISYKSFNETPQVASRPYDMAREGFIPSHGAATIIVEDLDHALERGAKIYAEILGVENSADGSHLPKPSREGQATLMKRLLKVCNVKPEEVDYVSAHATSTPLGDLTEVQAIKDVFGDHAYNLKLNAPKSMLGHTCWSAATVELVAAVLQMQRGELHPSVNIENLDPAIDLDICKDGPVKHQINTMVKNSFGFGGLNSISLLKRYTK